MEKNHTALLQKLSLEANQVKDLAKNAKVCELIESFVEKYKIDSLDKKIGNLFVNFVVKSQWAQPEEADLLARYILEGKLTSNAHVEEATKWVKAHRGCKLEAADIEDFEKSSGVGVKFSREDIEKCVKNFFEENKAEIEANPRHPNVLNKLRGLLRFAPQNEVMEIYTEITKDIKPAKKEEEKKPKETKEAKDQESKEKKDAQPSEEEAQKEAAKKFKLEKLVARDLGESLNPPDILEAHKKRTGGAVVTRFPPEPNGYLHIGHAKSIRFNFKAASDYGGYTYLRYDDTNPEKEAQEYIDSIKDMVEWLGYKPKYVTHASDNFQRIYDTALELIRRGKAFVCKLSKEDNKALREAGEPSPFRDSSVETNLAEFARMTRGFYDEGEAVLRAKIDPKHKNPNMRDPAIYRVKFVPHPHVGSKWCVYPLYDFVHSLCDSFEDITHSLCTLEFENRRELYYWSLDALNLYRPYVWEFSRLNLNYNVLSKRKILRLVETGVVSGWDDPRLFTLAGLRRRGYPAEAINEFCDVVQISRKGNDNVVQFSVLESVIRDYLYEHAPHAFVICDPVKLTLTNVTEPTQLTPKELLHSLQLSQNVFVERNDVKLVDQKDFFGIAPGKLVRLRYGPMIRIETVEEDPATKQLSVKAVVLSAEEEAAAKKAKGVLHWLGESDAVDATLRLFDKLFTTEFPGDESGDILKDVNPNSLVIQSNSKISKALLNGIKVLDRFQFERLGFFCVDQLSDIAQSKLVFNRIVGLKEKEKEKLLGK